MTEQKLGRDEFDPLAPAVGARSFCCNPLRDFPFPTAMI